MSVGFVRAGEIDLGLDGRLADRLHRLGGQPVPGGAEFGEHQLGEQPIDVVAAQVRVAVGREHLEHAVLDLEDRDVERAAAQVVDGDRAAVLLVEAVGQRRGGRLVDDAQHFEPGQAAGVARGGALRVVEVGRHGDDGTVHLEVELALLAEVLLGAALQLAQHERGDFRRRELLVADADAHHAARFAADPERQQVRFALHVVDAAAHEALH